MEWNLVGAAPLQNVRDNSAAEEVLAHSHHALMPFARSSPKTSQNAHHFREMLELQWSWLLWLDLQQLTHGHAEVSY